MNARQKAKKYKKELELYKQTLIKPTIIYETHKVETYRAICDFDTYNTPPDEHIKRILVSKIIDGCFENNLIHITTSGFVPDELCGGRPLKRYVGEIKIVRGCSCDYL